MQYGGPGTDPATAEDPVLATVRLVSHLNAVRHGTVSPEVAARGIVGPDVAHHVVDEHGLLGLDPLRANELQPAITAALLLVQDDWLLCLPRPGRTYGVRGPGLQAALDAGAAAVPGAGTLLLAPRLVGRAVQWTVHPADRGGPIPDAHEAERTLSETVLEAGRALSDLDLAPAGPPGRRPRAGRQPDPVGLAPGYPARQATAVQRAWRLYDACERALDDEGGAISSFEMTSRREVLRRVHDASADALVAACTWPTAPAGQERSPGP